MYKAQQKLGEARSYYQRAIDIGEKTLGAEHPQVATRLRNLGALLVDMEDFAGAEAAFARARAIRADALGDHHEDTQNAAEWIQHIAERRAGAAERLPHMKVALDVPEWTTMSPARRQAAAPLSPPAPAPAPGPEPELEESRVDFPTPPPPFR